MKSAPLFQTVTPPVLFQDLNNPATLKEIADTLDLSSSDLATMIEVKVSSIRWDAQMPTKLKERLQEFGSLCDLVATQFNGDHTRTAMWFKIPNPLLGEITPKDMIKMGRANVLRDLILQQINGEYA